MDVALKRPVSGLTFIYTVINTFMELHGMPENHRKASDGGVRPQSRTGGNHPGEQSDGNRVDSVMSKVRSQGLMFCRLYYGS